MTSHDISKRLTLFFSFLNESNSFLTYVRSFANAYTGYLVYVTSLTNAAEVSVQAERAKMLSFLDRKGREFRDISPRDFFREMDELDEALSTAAFSLDSTDPFQQVRARISAVAETYDEFLRHTDPDTTREMLRTAYEFGSIFETAVGSLKALKQFFEESPELLVPDTASVSILLHPTDELRVSVAKLGALERIYEELCLMLSVSTSQHPLRISRIESGSLWIKLFGESRVITLLTDVVKSGVDYLYRNYTNEGRLSGIPKRVEELEALLDLETKMKALGYDTEPIRESNRKSGAVIAKELNILLRGEAEVEVNDEVFSVHSYVDRLIAEKSGTLLLEEGSENDVSE